MDEVQANVREAVEGCLAVDVEDAKKTGHDEVIEITL